MEQDPRPLVPSEESSKNQDAQIHPKYDISENHGHQPAKVYPEFIKRLLPVFCFVAIIEAVALFLEHFADVFHGVFVELVNWVSLCLQLLIIAIPVAMWVKKCGSTKKWIWIPYGLICFIMLLAIYLPTQREAKPVALVKSSKPLDTDELRKIVTEAVKNANPSLLQMVKTNGIEWQPPELPKDCKLISFAFAGGDGTQSGKQMPKDGETISLIAGSVKDTNGAPRDVTIVGGHVLNNRFFADLLVVGVFGYGPFRLSGNKIEGRFPPEWQVNYDANAIEIVNNNLEPIYQVVYRRPEVVEIYGEFAAPGIVYILKRDGMEMRVGGKPFFPDPSVLGIKRIFKYPATSYAGQRIDRNE